jgi:hypothetical protein
VLVKKGVRDGLLVFDVGISGKAYGTLVRVTHPFMDCKSSNYQAFVCAT